MVAIGAQYPLEHDYASTVVRATYQRYELFI